MAQLQSPPALKQADSGWNLPTQMALLFCHLPLLFSKTLLPAERPWRYSGDNIQQAGNRHQEWIGGGWVSPLYKHRLLVNFGGLEQKCVLASISLIHYFSHTAPASHSGTQLVWLQAATGGSHPVVQTTGYFFRGPEFKPQHPHGSSQSSVTPGLGDLKPSSNLHRNQACKIQKYMQAQAKHSNEYNYSIFPV